MAKFKIGDVVRCIDNPKAVLRNGREKNGAGWKLGHTFKITSIDELKSESIYWRGIDGNGVYENSLELVNQNPKLKSLRKELILKWKENSK